MRGLIVARGLATIGVATTIAGCGGRGEQEAPTPPASQARSASGCSAPGIFFVTQQAQTSFEVGIFDPATLRVSAAGLLPCLLPDGVAVGAFAVDQNNVLFFLVDAAYGLSGPVGGNCSPTTFVPTDVPFLAAGLAFVRFGPGSDEVTYGSFFDPSRQGASSIGVYDWAAASPLDGFERQRRGVLGGQRLRVRSRRRRTGNLDRHRARRLEQRHVDHGRKGRCRRRRKQLHLRAAPVMRNPGGYLRSRDPRRTASSR